MSFRLEQLRTPDGVGDVCGERNYQLLRPLGNQKMAWSGRLSTTRVHHVTVPTNSSWKHTTCLTRTLTLTRTLVLHGNF